MTPPFSGDAIKHLRHDLRTPINHILGYTEMLLEDYEGGGIDGAAQSLQEIHAGGRTLLDCIQGSLGETFGSVTAEQLEALRGRVHPEAERLLKLSEWFRPLLELSDRGGAAQRQHPREHRRR
jgi:signal transduction histidine kinase